MLEQALEDPKTQKRLPPFRMPRQGEWTYQDWLNFPNDGWKYEIIDGVLFMVPPPAIKHQSSSISLVVKMYNHADKYDLGKVLEAPCGVQLPKQPVPVEPDILFIKKERLNIIGENYVEGAPDLIVEILSPSNPNYDRQTKFNLYQQSGVKEYWLVDYRSKTVEIFNLIANRYLLSGQYGEGETAPSTELKGFEVAVETLFKF